MANTRPRHPDDQAAPDPMAILEGMAPELQRAWARFLRTPEARALLAALVQAADAGDVRRTNRLKRAVRITVWQHRHGPALIATIVLSALAYVTAALLLEAAHRGVGVVDWVNLGVGLSYVWCRFLRIAAPPQ